MCANREGQQASIDIDPRVIQIQAKQSIRSLVDAIVELVTNADDSYRRLEANGERRSGKIEVKVRRKKGGKWDFLEVSDEAEGMDLERLEQILKYGGSSSGITGGCSVRGIFGRGLKEAILALGRGEITSRKRGRESSVQVWWDQSEGKAKYKILKDSRVVDGPDGTTVRVDRAEDLKISCPEFDKLSKQVRCHFALRDICSNKDRLVFLAVENLGGRRGKAAVYDRKERLQFKYPESLSSKEEKIHIEDLGVCTIKVFETAEPLECHPREPDSLAGWVIKTEGASLDRSLFDFDRLDAACYFFGEVFCPGIAQKVREGRSELVDAARSGLNWKHPLCKKLFEEVRAVLIPHVEKKQKELEAKRTPVAPPKRVGHKLRKLCERLNRWARQELESIPGRGGSDGGEVEPGQVTSLMIKPEKAHAKEKEPRKFSVYLPKKLAKQTDPPNVQIELQDIKGKVWLRDKSVQLLPSEKHNDLFVGHFLVTGDREGDGAYIVARWEGLDDIAEFVVREPGQRGPRDTLRPRSGGMFKDFDFFSDDNPLQRVVYDRETGVIRIYLRFPPLGRYLGEKGEGMETPEGSVLLAELVCEAFCREIARRKLDETPVSPGGEVDNYNRLIFELMRKYAGAIHELLVES